PFPFLAPPEKIGHGAILGTASVNPCDPNRETHPDMASRPCPSPHRSGLFRPRRPPFPPGQQQPEIRTYPFQKTPRQPDGTIPPHLERFLPSLRFPQTRRPGLRRGTGVSR